MHNHLGGIGHAVVLHVSLEEFRRHESGLQTILIFIRPPHLHEVVVFTHIHAGEVDNHLLTHAVVEEEVVGVHRECQRCGLVLNDNAFEHIAALVRRNYAALDIDMLAVWLGADLLAIVLVVLPVFLLEVEDGGVHLVKVLGHRGDRFGSVDVILAGNESAEGGRGHQPEYKGFENFHDSYLSE